MPRGHAVSGVSRSGGVEQSGTVSPFTLSLALGCRFLGERRHAGAPRIFLAFGLCGGWSGGRSVPRRVSAWPVGARCKHTACLATDRPLPAAS